MKLRLALATSLIALSSAAMADGEKLYTEKACNTCHGADGNAPTMATYPKIGGQNAEYAVQQLKDFKSGARSNGQAATMKAMLASVSEEEMQKISDYLATK